jgi:hypothetical protein
VTLITFISPNVKDFQYFCDRIGQKAQDRGLTEEKLLEILNPKNFIKKYIIGASLFGNCMLKQDI